MVGPACQKCNDLSRTADLVAAIVARWRFSELEQTEATDIKKLIWRLRYQAPQIGREWLQFDSGTGQKRARRHLQSNGVPVSLDKGYTSIGPVTIQQLRLFSHKLTLAMYFDLAKAVAPATSVLIASFLTKEDVVAKGISEDVKSHLGACQSLIQGAWDTSLQFEFRTFLSDDRNMFQMLARLRYGLFVHGTIIIHPKATPDEDWTGWIHPNELPTLVLDECFE